MSVQLLRWKTSGSVACAKWLATSCRLLKRYIQTNAFDVLTHMRATHSLLAYCSSYGQQQLGGFLGSEKFGVLFGRCGSVK